MLVLERGLWSITNESAFSSAFCFLNLISLSAFGSVSKLTYICLTLCCQSIQTHCTSSTFCNIKNSKFIVFYFNFRVVSQLKVMQICAMEGKRKDYFKILAFLLRLLLF